MFRKFLLTAVVAVAALLTSTTESKAAFTLTLSGGTTTVIIQDGGPGDLSGSVNRIVADQIIDGFQFSVTATTSAPDGSALGGLLTITQTTNITAGATAAAGVPVVTVFSDGFFFPGAPVAPRAELTNTLASTLFQGSGNAAGTSTIMSGGTTLPAVLNAPLQGQGANMTTLLVTVSSSPFSLSNQLTLTGLAGTNNFTGSLSTTATQITPAPAGLILAALGIPAFGLLRRIGRKTGAAEVAVAA